MAEAQFIPGQGAGNIVGALNSGLGTQASMMDRIQTRRLREQQADLASQQNAREQAQFEMLAPVRQAEGAAAIAKARAGIDNIAKNKAMIAEFSEQSKAAEDEWLGVMNLEDPEAQAKGAMRWTGKWMRFAALADFNPLWEQRKEIAGKFLQHAFDMRKLEAQFEANSEIAEMKAGHAGPGSPLGKMIADYKKALYGGKTDEANYLKAAIEADITPKGMRLEIGKDGQIIFAQGAQNGLTTTGSTRSEQSQFDAERTIKEGAELLGTLRAEDLGLQGVLQEDFVNKGLAQLRPEFADKKTSENRTRLRAWREGTMRQISADTRFSNTDRAAIERLLPQDGVFESLPSAKAKMLAVMNILQDRATMEASRRGTTSYLHTPQGIRDAVKAGKLEAPVAVELLRAFHPDFDPSKK